MMKLCNIVCSQHRTNWCSADGVVEAAGKAPAPTSALPADGVSLGLRTTGRYRSLLDGTKTGGDRRINPFFIISCRNPLRKEQLKVKGSIDNLQKFPNILNLARAKMGA